MAGIALRLHSAAATLAWLSRGVPMAPMGHAALPAPLARLAVMAHAGDRKASLAALLFAPVPSPGDLFGALTGRGTMTLRPPYAHLEAQLKVRRVDTALYVLSSDGSRAFGVVPGPLPNQVTVFCGDLPLLEWTTRPLTLTTAEAFQADVDFFASVVSITAAGLYHAAGATPPDLTVVLKPSATEPDTIAREAATRVGHVVDRMNGRPAAGPQVSQDRPQERFSDVGGQDVAVHELQTVLLALRSPERYRLWGVRPPKGVLFYGPPGTGKTLLARSLAGEAAASFFHVRATDVTSKWYGEAEQRLNGVFERARQSTPAIVFFDELDGLAPDRDGAHEATHRVVSTLLEHMDGLDELEGVIVVGATNRPGALDSALLRPGRFDRLVEVGLPTAEGREQILKIHCRSAERRAGRPLFAELDWAALRKASAGLSGADLSEAVRRALEARVRGQGESAPVTTEELLSEVEALRTRAF